MNAIAYESMIEKRRVIKTQRSNEVNHVKALIAKLVPQGSYADYLDIADRLNELEHYWELFQIQMRHMPFVFRKRIDTLRTDVVFIHAEYIANELEKSDSQDVHGFIRRIEEIANDLRTKKNVYTQYPEINDSLQKIVKLKHDDTFFKIQVNTISGRG